MALKYWKAAAEKGCAVGHLHVGNYYHEGKGGVEVNLRLAMHHWGEAAKAGCVVARYTLAQSEMAYYQHPEAAMMHYIIAATAGCDRSLAELKEGYKQGLLPKPDFEEALRAHQKSSSG